jgi:hypothetical protein
MRVHWSFTAAGAIAIGVLAWSPAHAQQTEQEKPGVVQKTGDAIGNAADKTGEAAKKAVDKTEQAVGLEASDDPAKNAGNIKGVIAQVAEAAVTKSGLDDVEERFTKADRERLDQNKDALKNNAALDGRIDQFQKDWKAKYNQDFKIPDKDAVYGNDFAMITQGEEARTASARITPGDTAKPAADSDKEKNARNYAMLNIPASHGKAALSVPLIHEGGSWKIDIPNSVDSNKLRDNVQTALTHCDEMKDQWPADVNDAYRGVTHAILIAVMDQPLDQKAQPAAGQLPADQGTAPAGQQPAPGQPAR